MTETLNAQQSRLFVNSQVHLITLATVRALLGWPPEKVKADVESGRLLWTFNFSLRGMRHEPNLGAMRFWVKELEDREAVKGFTIDQVEKEILGTLRHKFAPGDVCRRFSISKVDLMNARRQFHWPLKDLPRQCLADFLAARWIGAVQSRKRAA